MSLHSSKVGVRLACASLLTVLAVCVLTHTARAQTQPSQADSLFQSGLEKMRKGDYAEACPELAASYEIEPLPGALFTLAECEASWGKAATALKHYQLFIAMLPSLPASRRQKFEERRRLALEQITSLGATVPLLSLSVAAGAPSDLVVKRDDTVVPESSYGVQTPVDPGELSISAERSGKTLWQRRVRVASQDRANIVVPWPIESALGAAAGSEPASRAAQVAGAASPADYRAGEGKPEASKARNSLTTWKYVTAGVGAAGFTVSIVAGAIALGKKGTVNDECVDYRCTQNGLSQANSAKQAARVSTIGFIVGLVGAAGFTGLSVFGGPKQERTHAGDLRINVSNTANGGELRLDGSF